MNYSKAIKIVRATQNLSQQEFSKTTGLSPSLVSRIESGERALSDTNLKIISKKVKVPESLIRLLACEDVDIKEVDSNDIEKIGKTLVKYLINGNVNSDR